jgi:hypothetical protein
LGDDADAQGVEETLRDWTDQCAEIFWGTG